MTKPIVTVTIIVQGGCVVDEIITGAQDAGIEIVLNVEDLDVEEEHEYDDDELYDEKA